MRAILVLSVQTAGWIDPIEMIGMIVATEWEAIVKTA